MFATRLPARPNAAGMFPVRLLRVDGARLTVAQVGMLDGTPFFDIKPYVPEFDRFDVQRIGWYADRVATDGATDARSTASIE